MFHPLEKKDLKTFRRGTFTIIVPYRDQPQQNRAKQLDKFIQHFEKLKYPVLIIEQVEGKKFNRGKLLNVAASIVDTDYFILHDVDLLPKRNILPFYEVMPEYPIHLGKAWKDKYDSESFLGGVVSISKKDFISINGFPNNFWGWGGEDDAMRIRLKKKEIDVLQPTLESGYVEQTHVDTKSKAEWKNMERWEGIDSEKKGTNKSGFKNVKFKIEQEDEITPSIRKVLVSI